MNNTVPTYFYCENKIEEPGAGFVIETKGQRITARVLKFDNAAAYQNFTAGKKDHDYAQVGDYMIVLQVWDALISTGIDINENYQNRATELAAMANFYFEHTIAPKLSYYKRYLIKQD